MTARCLSVGALAAALLGCGPGTAASGNDAAGETTDMSGTGDPDTSEPSETGDTGEDEPMDCGGVAIQPILIRPEVMFVVDSSPSMARSWDPDGDPDTPPQTRWASVHGLLEGIASVLAPYASVGLQQFPSADACPDATLANPTCADLSACTIADAPELALTEEGMSLLLASLPPATAASEFRGGSPAAAAYASALAQLLPGDPQSLRTMVLITDGHLDCGNADAPPANLGVPDPALLGLIEVAYTEHHIFTIVVAVDEDAPLELGPDTIADFDPRPSLEALALAGGYPTYLSLANPYILESFEPPADDIDCTVDLTQTEHGPPTPEQIPLITWTIDGVPIPYIEPEACTELEFGWTWIVEGELIRFCGAACDAFQANALTEADYGCPDSN